MNEQTTQYLNHVYKIVTPEGTEYRITKKTVLKTELDELAVTYFKKVVKVTDLREHENDVIKADIENLRNDFSRISSQNNDNMQSIQVSVDTIKQSLQASIDANKQKYELKFTVIDKILAELTNIVNQIAKYINEQMANI